MRFSRTRFTREVTVSVRVQDRNPNNSVRAGLFSDRHAEDLDERC